MNYPNIKTDKDAFNFVAEMLLAQGVKSMDQDETCRYRGWHPSIINQYNNICGFDDYYNDEAAEFLNQQNPNLKCAVGHLIADEHYSYEIEGEGLNHDVMQMVANSHPEWLPDFNEDADESIESSWWLLQDLQKIHDTYPSSDWNSYFYIMRDCFDQDGKYTDRLDFGKTISVIKYGNVSYVN